MALRGHADAVGLGEAFDADSRTEGSGQGTGGRGQTTDGAIADCGWRMADWGQPRNTPNTRKQHGTITTDGRRQGTGDSIQ